MKEELDQIEEKILKALFPDKRLWYREFLIHGIADKPLRRSLKRLQEMKHIVKVTPANWKRGKKIPYCLTPKGKRIAVQLIIGDKAKDLLIQVLDRLQSIAKLPDDEGEKVLELALEIVNILDDKEKSDQLRDAVSDFIIKLKES